MKYKSLIFICLLICLFSIASVVASDVNETTVESADQSEEIISVNNMEIISEDNNDEKIGITQEDKLSSEPGTFTDLANEIENVTTELNLTNDYIYSDIDSNYINGITIHKKIIVNGNGHYIDGVNKSRAFNVLANNVVLTNITFINCNSSEGGALIIENENANINNCIFINCYGNGGAIYLNEYGSRISNCNFTDCTSEKLDETNTYGGGAIHGASFDYEVINCNFISCYGYAGGAILWDCPQCRVINCNFTNCSSNRGGAVSSYNDDLNLVNCNFLNCDANYGGALYLVSAGNTPSYTIDNCDFINCYANNNGGAITGSNSETTLINCEFINCSSYAKDVINWQGNNNRLINCTFDNEKYNYEEYIVTDNGFNPNLNVSVVYDDLYKQYHVFSNITPNAKGNVSFSLYKIVDHTNILLKQINNSFDDSFVKFDFDNLEIGNYLLRTVYIGDSVYATSSKDTYFEALSPIGTITDLINIINNNVNEINLTRSYVYDSNVDQGVSVTINKTITIDGMGHDINGTTLSISANNVILKNINFNKVKSTWGGNYGMMINCSANSYSSAASSGQPGTMIISGTNNTIINSSFSSNAVKAYTYGGAITWYGTNGKIINSTFYNNKNLYYYGGAIYWSGKNACVLNCTFLDNFAAEWGGAIHASENCDIKIYDSTFISNRAERSAGAIHVMYSLDAYNCSFIKNKSPLAAAVFASGTSSVVNSSLFYMNEYSKDYWDSYTCYANTVINSIFLNNTPYKQISDSSKGDYNWFGSTVENYLIKPVTDTSVTKWLFLDVVHEELIHFGKNNPLKFIFKVWDGNNITDYDSSKIHECDLILSTESGNLDKTSVVPNDIFSFNASVIGAGSITAKFFDRELTINLICKYPTKIIVNESITIFVDQVMKFDTEGLYAELIPSEAGNLVYSSDNNTILSMVNGGFKGINGGTANIIVEFIETDEYAPFKVLVPVTVLKYDAEITATDSITMDYNDSQTIIAELTPNVGNFVYSSDDVNIATVNNEGIISAVGTGTTTINVIFEGNRKYYPTSKIIQLTVNKINSNINLTKEIEFNYGSSDYVLADLDGVSSIQSYVIDHPEATVTVKNNKITVSGLDVGNYTLIAITVPDNNHISVNTTCNITVHKSDSSAAIPAIKFNYGSSATVNARLNGATGLINVKVENHTEALIYVSGSQITVSELDAGTYTLIVTTVPDSNHNAVNATATITVNKVNSVIEFTNDLIFDYEGSDYTSVDIQYATNITDIKVKNHPEAVINVEGNIITVSGLNAGTYTLSATTIPDKNHNAVTGTATITVNKIDSSLTIENDIVFDYGGSNYTYAIFNGATSIEANVVSYSATINIVGGKITISGLNAGTYTLRVTTVPDNNHKSVSLDAKITVNKVDPIVTISPVIFDYGQTGSTRLITTSNVNFEANVINHTEATIEIVGKRIYVSNLETGNYTLEIKAISNNNYNSINLTTNVTVNKADSTITASNIIFDYGSYGSTIVNLKGADKFNASVIDHPEAIVAIVGNEIFVSGLDVGTFYLNITSLPDKNHNAVTFTPRIFVNKVDASIIIPTIEFNYGSSTIVYPTLDGVANISYAFVSNHKEATVNITEENGIKISGLNAGKYTLVVTVTPDDNHNPISEVTSDIIVNKIDSTIIVPEINFNYGLYGSTKVTLEGATKFNANINGDSTHLTINDDGVIVVFGLNAGTHDLIVTTIPDSNHNPITTISKVIVNKLGTVLSSNDVTTIYGATKNIVVKLNDVNGNILIGQPVKITLNNVVYSIKTNSNGQAIISIPNNLPVKSHIVTVTFEGSANHAKSTTTFKVIVKKATPKITAKAKTFKKAVKTKKYSITLKDNKGKVIKKAKVTLKIKGKKAITVKTNSKGKATFKIKKLNKKGTYKSTVTYKGNKYYNKVSKKVKIKVK